MLTNSSILITGGTGSFGHSFVPMTLEKYNLRSLVIYSRDEMKQWEDMPLETISFPLKKTEYVERHVALDRLTDLNVVRTRIPVMEKVLSKIKFYLQTAKKEPFLKHSF